MRLRPLSSRRTHRLALEPCGAGRRRSTKQRGPRTTRGSHRAAHTGAQIWWGVGLGLHHARKLHRAH